jgi:hypothetical protein
MKKKICFIANYEKTFFFKEIAQEIEKEKRAQVYWIVVNLNLYNYLTKHFDKNRILLINKNFKSFKKNFLFLNRLKLNECLFLDRALSIKSKQDKEFLDYAAMKIAAFLKKKSIKYIYGEITWSHEIISYRISNIFKTLNAKYFYPSILRYPFNKFIFFLNYEQSKFFLRAKKNTHTQNLSLNEYLKAIKDIDPKKNLLKKKYITKKIYKLFHENYFDRNDPTQMKKIKRIKNLIFKYINIFTYKFFLTKTNLENFQYKKYIIYFLQKKPEASLDVKGMYYEDQFKNFLVIWRLLPNNFKLIVKEHPSCIGDNNLKFYKKFLRYNSTYIANENCSFENLVENSYATFSVASTASLQSSLLGVPSFTLVPCFFNEVKFSENISIDQFRSNNSLLDLVELMLKNNKKKKIISETKFIKNSFDGYLIGDKRNSQKNIKIVANAFYETFNN